MGEADFSYECKDCNNVGPTDQPHPRESPGCIVKEMPSWAGKEQIATPLSIAVKS
jgi:hypothetical protein